MPGGKTEAPKKGGESARSLIVLLQYQDLSSVFCFIHSSSIIFKTVSSAQEDQHLQFSSLE